MTDVYKTSSNALKPGVLSKWATADVSMLKQTLQLVYAWIINVIIWHSKQVTIQDASCFLGSSAGFLNETSGFLAPSLKTTDRTRGYPPCASVREKKSTLSLAFHALSHSLKLGSNENKDFLHNSLARTSSLLKVKVLQCFWSLKAQLIIKKHEYAFQANDSNTLSYKWIMQFEWLIKCICMQLSLSPKVWEHLLKWLCICLIYCNSFNFKLYYRHIYYQSINLQWNCYKQNLAWFS